LSAEAAAMPRTVPAREIKRRGIVAVDDLLREGAVHVIKDDEPRYVILSEDQYAELVDGYQEAYVSRVRASLAEAESGQTRRFSTAHELMHVIDQVAASPDVD
jgi:hypothetical protein